MNTTTLVFESIATGVFVHLTLRILDDSGRVRANLSIRSHRSISFAQMDDIDTLWRSWISSAVGGSLPPLPEGWRVTNL